MRLHLFERASYLKERIKLEQHSENLVALKVNDRFEVIFEYRNHRLKHSCTCKDGSLGGTCAHLISAFIWLTENVDIVRLEKK